MIFLYSIFSLTSDMITLGIPSFASHSVPPFILQQMYCQMPVITRLSV